MCRFSATLAPPPAPVDGLDALLNDADDFNWFDAIDELPEDELALGTNLSSTLQQQLPPAVPESDSSECPRPDGVDSSSAKSAGSAGCSDTSSYDLVELFKQQVEQAPAASVGAPCHTPVQTTFSQFVGAPFAAVQQQLMCGVAAPFAGACMPPQLLAGPLAPTPAFLPAAALTGAAVPAVLTNTVGTPSAATFAAQETAFNTATSALACRSGSAAAITSCGRRGSRATKTQEEIDAAVERIKQKRRESAQRSRARKNDYMHQLELENQALKDEVQRLQQVLAAVQRSTFQQQQAAALVQLGAM